MDYNCVGNFTIAVDNAARLSNILPSMDSYVESLDDKPSSQWSEPIFRCPKCDKGGMRKNLWRAVVLTCMPPIYEEEYKCDECGHVEHITRR